MRTADQLSADKLRGGFYTPAPLVQRCLDRVLQLKGDLEGRWLEPSAGDGAFARGLARRHATARLLCVEQDAQEAATCGLSAESLHAEVVNAGFFEWATDDDRRFDVLVGNPPFVRYQFVDPQERARAEALLLKEGLTLQGVSNLWIPFVLLGLSRLRQGGVFALVLPAELMATKSGGQVRRWLLENTEALQLQLFERASFPGILQEVLVLSGRRVSGQPSPTLRIVEERSGEAWKHSAPVSTQGWTRMLLSLTQLAAWEHASALRGVQPLSEVAKLQVSTVTGANRFFTIDQATREHEQLQPWARPMLPRSAFAEGLSVTPADHASMLSGPGRAWLLDFSAQNPEPNAQARAYLQRGQEQGLPGRYKCRVRSPWYRVPVVPAGSLMMTKRAHRHHRLLHNAAGLLSTDTLYQGRMLTALPAPALVASFHSALTLLSMELEGRSYGGGVLELVPSELKRLRVLPALTADALPELDRLSREWGGQKDEQDRLVAATDARLAATRPDYGELVDGLREGWLALQERRLTR